MPSRDPSQPPLFLSVPPEQLRAGIHGNEANLETPSPIDTPLTDYEIGLCLDADDPLWLERRDKFRKMIKDPASSMEDKMRAAGMLAAYFHDMDPIVYEVPADRLRQVRSDPNAQSVSVGVHEPGAWLQLMIGAQFLNIYSPDMVNHALEVNLAQGLVSRPGHILDLVDSMYSELELHRQRVRLSGASARVRRRMAAAIDNTDKKLLDSLHAVFLSLRDYSQSWLGETAEDRELLSCDRSELLLLLERRKRDRFGVWTLRDTDQYQLWSGTEDAGVVLN